MIVLNVTYKCRAGMREAFLKRIIDDGIGKASREEDGNIKYDYYIPVDSCDELLLVEKWRDDAALTLHASTEHFARLKELKPVYVLDTVVERYGK